VISLVVAGAACWIGCTDVRTPERRSERAQVVLEPPTSALAPAEPASELDFSDLDATSSSSVSTAVDRFLARQTTVEHDGVEVFEDLQHLLGFLDHVELLVDQRIQRDEAFADAVYHRLGECDPCGGHDESAVDDVEAFERDGMRVHRVDGSLVAVDLPALRRRLEPELSAPALAYLDALAWDEEHVARMEPVPDGIAHAIVLWERVLDAGEPYAGAARSSAALAADEYLGLCMDASKDEPTRCVVGEAIRSSYRRFLADHTTSRWHPAVEHYLREASRRRFAMSIADAVALRDESLLRARP
jgi:hypothetical protein